MTTAVIDQMLRAVLAPQHPKRIISLVPSQTELLFDLGLGERVVGITKFCVHPEEWFRSKPRVGGTKSVHIDQVRALKPDLIIGNKEENQREQIEMLEKEFPVWMSDVRDLGDALDMIRRVGGLTNTAHRAEDLVMSISERFMTIEPCAPAIPTVYLIWRQPYMAVGSNTFINDMLKRCGLENVLVHRPERYPKWDDPARDEVLDEEDPMLVLLSSEPYPFKVAHMVEVQQRLPRAKVLRVDGEMFSWYGSRLLKAPGYFTGLLDRMNGTAPPA